MKTRTERWKDTRDKLELDRINYLKELEDLKFENKALKYELDIYEIVERFRKCQSI